MSHSPTRLCKLHTVMSPLDLHDGVKSERVTPTHPLASERVTALSLLDATTASFALTSAVWLFEAPTRTLSEEFDLAKHMRHCLRITLNAYPHWCGRLKKINTLDSTATGEVGHLPRHAQRFGRIYAHYGTSSDPGVEFIVADSDVGVDTLYPSERRTNNPVWESNPAAFKNLLPPTEIDRLNDPNEPDESGYRKPVVAFQLTKLAGSAFVLGAKVCHPLADITSLVQFMKDWAVVSRCVLDGTQLPDLCPIFEPSRIDQQAAGDINAEEAEPGILRNLENLPFERYDWWATSDEKCESPQMPEAFRGQEVRPVGKAMPWSEWDVKAPVATRIVHFSPAQIDQLVRQASAGQSQKVSKHDVLLAHIWSCITRARGLGDDQGLVHCNFVYGVRPLFGLSASFLGSPIVMLNVERSGAQVADPNNAALVPLKIRESLSKIGDVRAMAAHLHSIAYEKSPQRIWQAFMGQRHILVTTWARAGVYEMEFGLGSQVRYVDGVVPQMDGNVLIKEAPRTSPSEAGGEAKTWTDDGVDVTINITPDAMERLVCDPLLLPVST